MKTGRKIFSIIITITSFSSHVIGQVQDDFSDLDFLNNPAWSGDTAQFKINTMQQLQLKSSGADTSYLSTQNVLTDNTEWSFWIKLSFNTSANNFARIYLISDHKDLTKPLNGYYIQVGGSNDSLTFCRQSGEISDRLILGIHINTAHSTNVIRIKVTHDSIGKWRLFADSLGGTNFTEEGVYYGTPGITTAWFGVYCKYTSSNSGKCYFDDFKVGTIMVDTVAPGVSSISVSSANEIDILFSEGLDKTIAETLSHYSTRHSGSPAKATIDVNDPRKLTLTFQTNFIEGVPDTITIKDICDPQGNCEPILLIPYCFYTEKSFDVLISEIMADPEPSAGLPACEYVELYNNTQNPISLKDWVFQYGTHAKLLPDISLDPNGNLILTKGDSLCHFGVCIDLFTASSSLANEGATLTLKNKEGKIIHTISYRKEWYQSSIKNEGGWSLEMIDPKNPCGCGENWKASNSPTGGTPGAVNSIHSSHPDNTQPTLLRAKIVSDHQLEVYFSEPMDSLSLSGVSKWTVDHGQNHPDWLEFVPPDYNRLRLWYPAQFEQGTHYTIRVSEGPKDCAGNDIDTIKVVGAALPEPTLPGDVVINEILADPAAGGARYVELYNVSNKVLSLKEMLIASIDPIMNSIDEVEEITADDFLFFPGEYAVITEDQRDVESRYFCPNAGAFIQTESLPTYQPDQDEVVLIRKYDNIVIDQVRYTKEMYFPLFNRTDGISLERINPFIRTDEQTNWHSASESCGFGTPGYRNSQYMGTVSGDDWVNILQRVFSPDNDGRDDFLYINLHPDRPGYVLSITIFDEQGRMVRRLAGNMTLSGEDQVIWDGTDNNHLKVSPGIYLCFLEFIHPQGGKKQVKKSIVLAGSF